MTDQPKPDQPVATDIGAAARTLSGGRIITLDESWTASNPKQRLDLLARLARSSRRPYGASKARAAAAPDAANDETSVAVDDVVRSSGRSPAAAAHDAIIREALGLTVSADGSQTAFTSTREACLADAAWNETPIPVTEAAWRDHVRPAGWVNSIGALDVEVLDAGHVRVLWRVDGRQPDASTVFGRDEWVLVK